MSTTADQLVVAVSSRALFDLEKEHQLFEKEGYEADDLLGTIAKQSEAQGLEVSIVSGDRDLLQLASDHIKIRIPKTKRTGTEIEDYLAKDVVEKYQVTP